MRIIFNSKEEKEEFFDQLAYGSVTCPSDIGLSDSPSCGNSSVNCRCEQCWRQSVAWEVKEPKA